MQLDVEVRTQILVIADSDGRQTNQHMGGPTHDTVINHPIIGTTFCIHWTENARQMRQGICDVLKQQCDLGREAKIQNLQNQSALQREISTALIVDLTSHSRSREAAGSWR